jgi:hypothetical protein
MGVDRAGAGADDPGEAAEEPPPPDRRPPPDRPGAEGAPSRADSRNGAAAANDARDQAAENQGEEKPDTAQESQETSEREGNTTVDNEPETPGTSESNEGLSNDDGSAELYDNNPTQEAAGGSPDTAQPSDRPDSLPKETGNALVSAPDTQEPPRDSLNTPADVARDDTREPTRPADATTETAASPEVEGQPETADKAQPNPPDQTLPTGDAKGEADQPSDGLREKTGAGEESGEDPGSTFTASTGTPDQRLERPDNEAEPGADGTAEDMDADREHPLGDRLMVGDVPLREYLNSRGRTAADSDVVGEPGTGPTADLPPTGEELVEMDSDKLSRFEKLRKEGHKELSDALDVTAKGFDLGVGAFARPPTHAETRTAQPDVVEAPHHAVTAGEAAAGLLAAGVLMSELVRWGHGKLTPEKRRS